MTRQFRLPVLLGSALLVVVVALALWAILLANREPVDLGSTSATPTAPASETSSPTAVAGFASPTAIATPDASTSPGERPLALPVLSAGESCPISTGSKKAIPPESEVFCAECFWFGSGPVYFAMTYNNESAEATFSLDGVPYSENAYRAKTPWTSDPDYSGPIRIRGGQLDGTNEQRPSFSNQEETPADELLLTGYGGPSSTLWPLWRSLMWVPGPGCYGVQIDTEDGTDIVIFEATRSAEPAPTPASPTSQ